MDDLDTAHQDSGKSFFENNDEDSEDDDSIDVAGNATSSGSINPPNLDHFVNLTDDDIC